MRSKGKGKGIRARDHTLSRAPKFPAPFRFPFQRRPRRLTHLLRTLWFGFRPHVASEQALYLGESWEVTRASLAINGDLTTRWVHTYPLQSGNFWIRYESGKVWTLNSDIFFIQWRYKIEPSSLLWIFKMVPSVMLSFLYFLDFSFKSYNVCAVRPSYDYCTVFSFPRF